MSPKASGPMHPSGLTRKSAVKIPPSVLESCAGLAIFNVLRLGGGHSSLGGGSGVVVARRADGTWSPPSSFIISSLGAGFMFGLNMYDCVCVLNTPEQVEAFTKPRLSFGAEGAIAFGPVGSGSHVETAVSKTAQPMWSYMKSRGLWAGVQVDGTVIVSRSDANAVFYNERGISTQKILQGDVAWPLGAKPLFDVLQAIGGRATYSRTLSHEDIRPPPSDASLYNATPVPAQQEMYRDEPENAPDVKKPEVEAEEPKFETALEEKERLAKTGY
jgi:SH3 domain-containing YSC84-like protein 1